MTTTLETIETKADELNKEISPALDVAREISVKDTGSYEMAGTMWKDLTGLEKRIKLYWEDDVSTALKLHRSLVAKRDAMLEPVAECKNDLRMEMKAFEDAQERARREAQAKAEAEARKLAEEQALAEAVKLAQEGHQDVADAILAAPVVVSPVFIPKTTPKGFGSATRRTWSAEVTDMMALVQAVAAGVVPIQALEANTVFLGAQARALKGSLAIPGVRAVEK